VTVDLRGAMLSILDVRATDIAREFANSRDAPSPSRRWPPGPSNTVGQLAVVAMLLAAG
jgi:hypothetical protein